MVDCMFAQSVNFDYTREKQQQKLFWVTILEVLVHDDLY